MKETKHTPGPWKAHHGKGQMMIVQDAKSNSGIANLIAFTGGGIAEDDANARLIAAAPDLLEALDFCRKFFNMQAEKGNPVASQLTNIVNKALAKAQGVSK